MKQISSSLTLFYKRIFPTLWFGLLSVLIVGGLIAAIQNHSVPFPVLIIPLVMMVFGYFLIKHLCWSLVDRVYDGGDSLLVQHKGEEDTIQLANIINVNFVPLVSPPTITLALRKACKFGTEVKFMTPVRINPFRKNPFVEDLIARIDTARRS